MKVQTVGAFVVVLFLTASGVSFAQTGVLKVTSFPSGAQVWVDGTYTGKVTPMSISVTLGDHQVTVKLADSSWKADERTVTILGGNNDLSVTLLPAATQGERGPQGERGLQGERGPQGEPGNLQLAGLYCPAGTFVRGFDGNGRLVCASPTAPPTSDPGTPPTSDPGTPPTSDPGTPPTSGLAEQVRDALLALTGLEGAGPGPMFSMTVPLGTVTGTVGYEGFALCQPANPEAQPGTQAPIYGCSPSVTAQMTVTTPGTARLVINVPHAFIDAMGSWELSGTVPASGQVGGYVLLSDLHVEIDLPLTSDGAGNFTFGDPAVAAVTYTADSHLTHSGWAGEALGPFLGNMLLSGAIDGLVGQFLSAIAL